MLLKVPDNPVLRKAKANAGHGLRAAIVRHVRAAIKGDQTAKDKGPPQANKVRPRRVLDNKVNNHAAANVRVVNAEDHNRAVRAAAIAAHVNRLHGRPACSGLRRNNSARNLAAARSRSDVRAAVPAGAAVLRAAKVVPAAIKVHAVVAADVAESRADAMRVHASSWPRPSPSQSCH